MAFSSKEKIQYGSHSGCELEFEYHGPEVKVWINSENNDNSILVISKEDQEKFINDFKAILEKYYL